MNRSDKQPTSHLVLPADARRLLLHSCCAPCAGGILESLVDAGVSVTLFFCNPNIHPRDEYLLRKEEQQRFAAGLGVPFVEDDYDPAAWLQQMRGLEEEPERGERCRACFRMRLESTAAYAATHGFNLFATALGISRWKDLAQVNEAGLAAAQKYPAVAFWPYNWRKQGGSQRMVAVTRRENFYRQPYCGCVYSLHETNRRLQQQGRPPIVRPDDPTP